MRYWSCEFDVSCALAANLTCRHFYTTTLTDNTLIANTLVLTTRTLVVLARTKNLFTKESSTFRSLSTIVDSLRDENFTIREVTDIITARKPYRDSREIIEVLSDSYVALSGMFSDLRVVGDLVI
jgi:hypothetical protein